MELTITTLGTQKTAEPMTVSDDHFSRPYNESLVHQVVTAYLAGARQGTRGQKNRSAVSGGGKKPWRQKGTGNARAGTIRSPLWRGGGVTFAAKNQNHSQKVNKKMYRQGLCAILSELVRQDRLVVVDSLTLPEPKTKLMLEVLARLDLSQTQTLLVTDMLDETVYLSARNLHYIDVVDVLGVNPVNLVRYEKIVMTKAAIVALEEKLS